MYKFHLTWKSMPSEICYWSIAAKESPHFQFALYQINKLHVFLLSHKQWLYAMLCYAEFQLVAQGDVESKEIAEGQQIGSDFFVTVKLIIFKFFMIFFRSCQEQ